ncbi:hypothetical protein PTTG_27005 [Puccinia triticina 1-1 BBBD Race 1]|uniref:Uncharacterized protein n=1 Tax=Puccinia triticina (isolate 1-1 / race 1 (BBBD)) TaxID=630390 RepID=A0A180GNS3_PUCT1|nr:hypothetical protein PTTG_27005 [Puccinia triticina 1-1 BBBD Race 1]
MAFQAIFWHFCLLCLILSCFDRILAPRPFDLNLPPVAEESFVEQKDVVAHEALCGSPSNSITTSITPQPLKDSRKRTRDEESTSLNTSTSVANIERLPADEPKGKQARLNLIQPEISHLNGFNYFKNTKAPVAAVRECQRSFEGKISSPGFDCSTTNETAEFHPSLRFSMNHPKHAAMTSRLLRVLSQGKENRVQSVNALKVLFKKLLTYVYELHQTVLNKSGMTAPAQRLQHQRLFKWLLKEIFEPDHNILPVMGRIQQPYPDWKGDQTFERLGATQIGLIDYFSGKGEHEEAAEEAANLVKIYQEQHQEEYLSPSATSHAIHQDLKKSTQEPQADHGLLLIFQEPKRKTQLVVQHWEEYASLIAIGWLLFKRNTKLRLCSSTTEEFIKASNKIHQDSIQEASQIK